MEIGQIQKIHVGRRIEPAQRTIQVEGRRQEWDGQARYCGQPYEKWKDSLADQFIGLNLGPGSVAQAHTADEWVDVEQLRAAVDILYDFAIGCANAELTRS